MGNASSSYPAPMRRLAELLAKLPGIGDKSGTRMALAILKAGPEYAKDLGEATTILHDTIVRCSHCHNLADADPCATCSAPDRRDDLVCVVERPSCIPPIERSGKFNGRYHVLGGSVAPIDGVSPEDLSIGDLAERVKADGVVEVIIATGTGAEGEITASCVAEALAGTGVKVTRIAYGLPVGSDLEYADEITVGRALTGRTEVRKP